MAVSFLAYLAVSVSCSPKNADIQVIPPPTPLLSRSVIGYGVIGVSYARVTAEPDGASLSLGWFRRGAIVEVLERRSVAEGERARSWIFVAPAEQDSAGQGEASLRAEGNWRGWLRENLVQIYANQAQAETAARGMIQ